ncbi:MAG: selenide, water dikinase SelD [Candidatus Eisenbacteria bacterium]
MGPGDLEKVLSGLPRSIRNKRVLVGLETLDDAGVYLIKKDLALVHTVDFFTPIVDDAYSFGAICAANALSDVYAMGARPVTALSVVCFPSDEMSLCVLQDMLRGGIDKLREAGVELLGGHSVRDKEVKFGFAVTGTVRPSRMVLKSGVRPGDVLVLTKPLGIGVLSTALKRGLLAAAQERLMVRQMAALNANAAAAMLRVGARACTDITGFGLLGHSYEMAHASNCTITIDSASVPLLKGVLGFIRQGVYPGGLLAVRKFVEGKVKVDGRVPDDLVLSLCDPQTSGGLLISLPSRRAKRLLNEMGRSGAGKAVIVGEAVRKGEFPIRIL